MLDGMDLYVLLGAYGSPAGPARKVYDIGDVRRDLGPRGQVDTYKHNACVDRRGIELEIDEFSRMQRDAAKTC